MDIPSLSISLSTANLQAQVSTAVLSMSLETSEQAGAGLLQLMDSSAKAMEHSVHPEIGSNIDISI